jgi:glutathione S-transferase
MNTMTLMNAKTSVNYLSVEEAVGLPGLRIAFTQGVPGPWSEAARAFFDIKGIDYRPVSQIGGAPNEALKAWTGQSAAPVAVYNDEPPRAHWSELLMLAERLGREPKLIPPDENDRVMMFGLCHELCAEDGFGWNARLLLFDGMKRRDFPPTARMLAEYSYGAPLKHARERVNAVIALLARQLSAQEAKGREYFVGNALTAADIYWTTFSNMLRPMPEDICPMSDFYRKVMPEICCGALDEPLAESLIRHRDRILGRHFKLPMRF